MDMSAHAASESEPKPSYQFRADAPPAALADYRYERCWVCFKYVQKNDRWTKPPVNPHTGRLASVGDSDTWGTFDEALACANKRGLPGLGIVLHPKLKMIGCDLDDCINDAGCLSPLAAEVIGYAESYAEITPSRAGLRILVRGELSEAVTDKALGIEIYSERRFLTVTGDHIPDTPTRIDEAPRTLARLNQVVEEARRAKKAEQAAERQKSNGSAANGHAHGNDFFGSVNAAALRRLDEWVPLVLRTAVKKPNGAWRVTSADLGRNYEEDLSLHPSGIADFGPEKGLTPIDVVMQYGGAPDPAAAAMWLCERMGIEPATLGWKHARSHAHSNGHAHARGVEPIEWPDPAPLPHNLLAVGPFDCAVLPENVRPWVEDVSERMQCPPDYAGVTVMVGLGSVIGRNVALHPKVQDDWSVIPNLWGMIIGTPGAQKSPAQNESLRPLKSLAAAAREDFNLAMADYDLKMASAKARAKNAEKEAAKLLTKNKGADINDLLRPEKIEEPTLRRYITTNATYEALAVLMQQNPNGLLVERDEMLSLLDHLDEEGQSNERGFYLQGANGDSSYTVDRIGRGLDLHIDAVCISMIGGTQPARISQYLTQVRRGGRGNDGLIQRFGLMVWPDLSPTWTNIDRKPHREARDAAFRAFQMLDTLDWRVIGGKRDFGRTGDEEGLPYVRFCEDGQERFLAWRTELEQRLRQGS